MVVDGGRGSTANQLKQVVYSQKFFRDKHEGLKGSPCVWLGLGPAGCHEFFEFNYISSDGSDLWATIRFMNRRISPAFKADVEDWTGEPLRIVGPSVKLTQ